MNDEEYLTNEPLEPFPDQGAAMAAGIIVAEGLLSGQNEPLPLPGLESDGNGQPDEKNAEWSLWSLLGWFK